MVFTAAASRQRQSPYEMTPVQDALAMIFANTRVNPSENLAVDEQLLGYILSEDVFCSKAIPELPTTNVDGYAVRCERIPAPLIPDYPSH